VKALALLGPSASLRSVERFGSENVQLKVGDVEHLRQNDAALVFGGDGTIHRYLPELHKYGIPFLVVPTGSGNDFARSLGLRSEKIALQAWRQYCASGNNLREIDLGVITRDGRQTLFCCVAGAGLDAGANARANRMPAWLRKTAGYLIAGLRELASFTPVEFHLTTDTASYRRTAFLVAIGNAHSYGGGMKVVPRATLDDGLLDVCIVGKMSKIKVLFCVPTIFFGAHIGIREVEYFQARNVRLEAARPTDLYADGEFAGQTPLEISLISHGLKVIVPG
jgi:diacylglycerol kinase (ATP)